MADQLPSIAMTPVKSSNIESIGHDGSTLAVKFIGGATHHYEGVPAATFEKLRDAESVGKAFHSLVRNSFKGIPAK